jgi:uncharacterized membrane protein
MNIAAIGGWFVAAAIGGWFVAALIAATGGIYMVRHREFRLSEHWPYLLIQVVVFVVAIVTIGVHLIGS